LKRDSKPATAIEEPLQQIRRKKDPFLELDSQMSY